MCETQHIGHVFGAINHRRLPQSIHASVKNLGTFLFPGLNMDSLHIICIVLFFRFRKMLLFYVYVFFLPIPEDAF